MADGKDVDTIQNEIHDMLIVILSDNNFADGDLVARAGTATATGTGATTQRWRSHDLE